jgi:Mg-chelatase subunit ChlD
MLRHSPAPLWRLISAGRPLRRRVRRGQRSWKSWLALAALGGAVAAGPAPAAAQDELRLSILTPRDRTLVAADRGRMFLAGRALMARGEHERYDVVVVIDTSRSTAAPAGADVDGDGRVGSGAEGRWIIATSDDAGDTVLAAQIAATRILLRQLNSATTRVGVVTFAGGEDPQVPHAIRLAPLTDRYDHVERALDVVRRHRPSGKTDIAAAIEAATSELTGSGRSRPRADATPVMLLMTDGQPTLPFATADENVAHTLAVGRRAGALGVRIDTFPIGARANSDVLVLGALAAQSGGRFTPVLQPADLLATFESLTLATLESISVRNLTTGESAAVAAAEADGYFSALVPVRDGENQLEVQVRDAMGRTAVRVVSIFTSPEARPPLLPLHLAARRRMLLETRLLDLYRDQMEHVRRMAELREQERSVTLTVDELSPKPR